MTHNKPISCLVSAALLSLAACGDPVGARDLPPGGGEESRPPVTRISGGDQRQNGGVHTIVDNTGLGGPVAQFDVPPGWRVESAVRWDNQNGQCSMAIASPMFRMTSADGRSGIEVFPGFLVTTSEQDIRRRGSQPGDFCIIGMAESGEALAQRIAVPFLRPQARIQGMRQVPLDPMIAQMAQGAQRFQNPNMRFFPYSVETLISNPDGTMEKIILGGMISAGQQMMPGVPPLVLNQNFVGYAMRAPADQLAEVEALTARVRASIRFNPGWENQVKAFQNGMTRPVFPDPAARPVGRGDGTTGTRTGGGDWIDDVRTGQARKDASDDRIQDNSIRGIREEQQCPGPNGPITVSIHVPCPQ